MSSLIHPSYAPLRNELEKIIYMGGTYPLPAQQFEREDLFLESVTVQLVEGVLRLAHRKRFYLHQAIAYALRDKSQLLDYDIGYGFMYNELYPFFKDIVGETITHAQFERMICAMSRIKFV
jgi:hypothetical protein